MLYFSWHEKIDAFYKQKYFIIQSWTYLQMINVQTYFKVDENHQ